MTRNEGEKLAMDSYHSMAVSPPGRATAGRQ